VNFLGMGPMELMLILVLALIVFGPGKLPEIAGQVGKAVRDVRRATTELSGEFNRTLSLELEEKKEAEAAATAPVAPAPAPLPAVTPLPVPVPDAEPAPIAISPAPVAEAPAPLPMTDNVPPSGPVASDPERPPETSSPPPASPAPPPPPALETVADASSVTEPPLADTSDWHWEEPWIPDQQPKPGTPIGVPNAANAPPAAPPAVAQAPSPDSDPPGRPEDVVSVGKEPSNPSPPS
jgi:sec-independent protein translocase protein TatB